ncbi:MAG: DUF5110 domain-containing protein [Bacteroidaceae bacterium]|nr:DUF5110 domain-containing protein [Bacteroidaceae bacterium]
MKQWKKQIVYLFAALFIALHVQAADEGKKNDVDIPFNKGTLRLKVMTENAVRVQYIEGEGRELPEWIYLPEAGEGKVKHKLKQMEGGVTQVETPAMSILIDGGAQTLTVNNAQGEEVFKATSHQLQAGTVQGEPTYSARLQMESPADEYLYGLGQFQDGYSNVRGLTRRLTQVNTQIAIPFILSSRGYGLLWNNYGLTDFNPATASVKLEQGNEVGEAVAVNVTSTEGGKREVRRSNAFKGTLDIPADGRYALLLDVGQNMARRHHLNIAGKTIVDVRNTWLPPTTSVLVDLKAGKHEVMAELERNDRPVLYYRPVDNQTTLQSPVASCVDYTLFVGGADDVIASYRDLTGEVPMLPQWALGYVHCRERYKSQKELLENAATFRQRKLPIDLIVQDWQYWGKYGWNSMQFDETHYPDPAAMMKSLHDMNMRLMLSVWSKIDANSEVGKQMTAKGYYIPRTSWIDFFNPDAAAFYWKNFSERLLKPYGIDAWWQDATEPENDDLVGRRVNNQTIPGEVFRNVYPLLVSKTVYEGCRTDDPARRHMIFTRSAFPGIQRYGSVFWSGDVGNDWETLRRQIVSGLGLVSTGLPWWTYDAGGFFRPGNQHSNPGYIECMLRWIQAGTFLPLMRVHGYMSDTEPWRYGEQAEQIIAKYLELRYRLLPYIYSEAARVSYDGSTLMRPLVFDFAGDEEALKQDVEYMFGPSLLINPVVKQGVTQYQSYLPEHAAGWYDFWTGKRYTGKQHVSTDIDLTTIPVFVKGGSIIPFGPVKQYAAEVSEEPIALHIYPGADATFCLYEDEGINHNYESGACSRIPLTWDEAKQTLTIGKRQGAFEGMQKTRIFTIVKGDVKKEVTYKGKKLKVALNAEF